jgi:hypothetical protein
MAAVFVTVPGCDSEPAVPDGSEPRCQARRHTHPPRLVLDARAEQFGAIAPCRAIVGLAIDRRTSLRSIEASITISTTAGEPLKQTLLTTALSGSDAGLLRGEIRLDPIADRICRGQQLIIERVRCRDKRANRIDCPAMRVRESRIFDRFSVSGDRFEVCFDD